MFQYQFSACVPLSNRVCLNLTACPVGYAEIVGATANSDRICGDVSNTPPTGSVFASAIVDLSNMPSVVDQSGNTDPTFELLFPAAVSDYMKPTVGTVLVSIISISQVANGAARRSVNNNNVTVNYRVQAASSASSSLNTELTDASKLNNSLVTLAPIITGGNDYDNVLVSFPSTQPVNNNGGGGTTGSSTSTQDYIIVGSVVGGIVLMLLVLLIVVLIMDKRRSRADLKRLSRASSSIAPSNQPDATMNMYGAIMVDPRKNSRGMASMYVFLFDYSPLLKIYQ